MSNIIKVRNNEGEWISIPALAGADGITPHIGENGHWFIGETDTGVTAGGLTEIPVATTDTVGGIKVGANLTIDEDGNLNAADPVDLTDYATTESVDTKIDEAFEEKLPDGTQLREYQGIIYKAPSNNIVEELLGVTSIEWAEGTVGVATNLVGVFRTLCSGDAVLQYSGNTVNEVLETFKANNLYCTATKNCIPYTASNGVTYTDIIDMGVYLTDKIFGFYSDRLGFVRVNLDISGSYFELSVCSSTGTLKYRLQARDGRALVQRVEYEPTQLENLDVLSKTNTIAYTPTTDYNPATKKYVDDAVANIDLPEIPTYGTLPTVGESSVISTLDGDYVVQNLGEKVRTVYTSQAGKQNHYFDGYADIQTRIEWGTSYAGTSFNIAYGDIVKTITFGDNEGIYDGEETVEDVASLFESKITEAFGENVIQVYGNDMSDYGHLVFYYKNVPQKIITILDGTTLPLLGIEPNVSTCRLDNLTIKTVTKTSAGQVTININEYAGTFSTDITLAELFDAINAANTDVKVLYDFDNDVFKISASTEVINYEDSIGLLREIGFNATKTETQESAGYELSVTQPNGQLLGNVMVDQTEFALQGNELLLYLLQKVTNNNILDITHATYDLPEIGATQFIETLDGDYTITTVGITPKTTYKSIHASVNDNIRGIESTAGVSYSKSLANTSFNISVDGVIHTIVFGADEGDFSDRSTFAVQRAFMDKFDAACGVDKIFARAYDLGSRYTLKIYYNPNLPQLPIILLPGGDESQGLADALSILKLTSGATNVFDTSATISSFLGMESTDFTININDYTATMSTAMTFDEMFETINGADTDITMEYNFAENKFVITDLAEQITLSDSIELFNVLGFTSTSELNTNEMSIVEIRNPEKKRIAKIYTEKNSCATKDLLGLLMLLQKVSNNNVKPTTTRIVKTLNIPDGSISTWTTTAPYYVDLNLAGVTEQQTAHITPIYPDDVSIALTRQENWNKIDRAVTMQNKIRFYCFEEKPSVLIPVQIELFSTDNAE